MCTFNFHAHGVLTRRTVEDGVSRHAVEVKTTGTEEEADQHHHYAAVGCPRDASENCNRGNQRSVDDRIHQQRATTTHHRGIGQIGIEAQVYCHLSGQRCNFGVSAELTEGRHPVASGVPALVADRNVCYRIWHFLIRHCRIVRRICVVLPISIPATTTQVIRRTVLAAVTAIVPVSQPRNSLSYRASAHLVRFCPPILSLLCSTHEAAVSFPFYNR